MMKIEKFRKGIVQGYLLKRGAVTAVRVFDDRAHLVFASDDVPTADARALLESWCVEVVHEIKG